MTGVEMNIAENYRAKREYARPVLARRDRLSVVTADVADSSYSG